MTDNGILKWWRRVASAKGALAALALLAVTVSVGLGAPITVMQVGIEWNEWLRWGLSAVAIPLFCFVLVAARHVERKLDAVLELAEDNRDDIAELKKWKQQHEGIREGVKGAHKRLDRLEASK